MEPPKVTLLTKWRVAMAILSRYGGSGTTGVGLRLLDHYNSKSGRCDPSYERLARATGMSRRNAMRCVERLVADRFLKVVEGRLGTSNVFDFDWTRGGDIGVTSGSDIDVTGVVTPATLSGDIGVTTTGDMDVTQNNESLNSESNRADETELEALIGRIANDPNSEAVKPKRKTERDAGIAVERCFHRVSGLSFPAALALYRSVPGPVKRALANQCLSGRLRESIVARVAKGVVGSKV